MGERTRKAWNGGSVEEAMRLAREWRDKAIAQGASLCDECGGEGGSQTSGVCIQCHGAGCVGPFGGLTGHIEELAQMSRRMRYHAIERTSPKGQPFIGTCRLCGTPNLPAKAALDECPNQRGLTAEEALIETIDPLGTRAATPQPHKPNARQL